MEATHKKHLGSLFITCTKGKFSNRLPAESHADLISGFNPDFQRFFQVLDSTVKRTDLTMGNTEGLQGPSESRTVSIAPKELSRLLESGDGFPAFAAHGEIPCCNQELALNGWGKPITPLQHPLDRCVSLGCKPPTPPKKPETLNNPCRTIRVPTYRPFEEAKNARNLLLYIFKPSCFTLPAKVTLSRA
jgi:hypothetical protein